MHQKNKPTRRRPRIRHEAQRAFSACSSQFPGVVPWCLRVLSICTPHVTTRGGTRQRGTPHFEIWPRPRSHRQNLHEGNYSSEYRHAQAAASSPRRLGLFTLRTTSHHKREHTTTHPKSFTYLKLHASSPAWGSSPTVQRCAVTHRRAQRQHLPTRCSVRSRRRHVTCSSSSPV